MGVITVDDRHALFALRHRLGSRKLEEEERALYAALHVYLNHTMHSEPALEPTVDSALAVQVGGGHYKGLAIQPVEYIHKNGIGFCEGNAIKYLTRWRSKGGVEDLKKARHFIALLIELEGGDV